VRIAFLVYGFPVVSETFILNQITGLLDAGHDVEIHAAAVSNAASAHPDVERYRLRQRTWYHDMPRSPLRRLGHAAGLVIRTGAWRRPAVVARALDVRKHGRPALALGLLYSTVSFMERAPYDIVHCQFATLAPTALALHEVGALSGRLVVSFRGTDLTTRRAGVDWGAVFRGGHLFLPVCAAFREQLVARGCDPAKIRVHHSGIRVSRFAYRERRPAPGEPTRVLTIARLIEKKGVAYALRAVSRVKAAGRRMCYTVVGDGPLRGDLERMVAELGLGADVHLAGVRSQDDVIALLHDSHLLVAPSVTASTGNQEGIPNVLKEAMATGIPTIATRHSGIPELIDHDVSGLLVPERDAGALAASLIYLIDHPERWADMARAGRKRVEAEFDSDTLNRELIALYRQLAAGPVPGASR
jgi:colanic acid/amylovoran biosynthesis glycosyltransferase